MAARAKVAGRKGKRRLSAEEFYLESIDEAERALFEAASEIEGIDQEIALLRTKLRKVANENRPEDFQLMLRGMELLVKAVATRYRLSKKAEQDLASSLARTLDRFGSYLLGEERDG